MLRVELRSSGGKKNQQPVLLIAKPSLQPHPHIIFMICFDCGLNNYTIIVIQESLHFYLVAYLVTDLKLVPW